MELLEKAIIDGVQVCDVLVETDFLFSMLSAALYEVLLSRPPIRKFDYSAPNIIAVGGTIANIRGFIDVPAQIAGAEVSHPLLLVTDLPFSLLIKINVLRLNVAKLAFEGVSPLQFGVRVCSIFFDHRV